MVDSGKKKSEVARLLKLSRRVIYLWIELREETGDLKPKSGYQKGHSHRIKDWRLFEKFAHQNKGNTTEQMAKKWTILTGQSTSDSVIGRGLKKIGFTFKKKTFHYSEANEKKRAEYLKIISEVDPKKIVYSDETGIDDNEVCLSGWAPRGKRCYSKKKAFRNTRYNITAALSAGKLIAPFLFEGYSNQAVYETYIEQVLVPVLDPGMVFVIDNARFHKSQRITDLIEGAGCRIIFLPPYSPDLNPIEHWWTPVKEAIKRAAEQIDNFYEAAIQGIAKICTA